jgi:FkbM family methyltransferase
VTDAIEVKEFTVPGGGVAHMTIRTGTNDYNTLASCMNDDEYRLQDLNGGGVAVDIGAYIGGVTVALAVMGGWRVIAVEALSENVAVLRENVERNVKDPANVTILHNAGAKTNGKTADVQWNFTAGESGLHHRFIGNAQLIDAQGGETETVPTISLAALVEMAGGHIDFLKIDCEGCEYGVLSDSAALSHVGTIHGEYHAGADRLRDLLEPTHVVNINGQENLGGFTATLR